MSVEHLIARLASDARPVRVVRPIRVRLIRWLVWSCVVLSATTLVLGLRADLPEMLTRAAFVLPLGVLGLTAILAAASSLVASVPGAERSAAQRWTPMLIALVWPALLALQPADGTAGVVVPAGVCALFITGIAVVPAILLLRYVREGAVLAPARAMAMTMLAAGCGAALVQQLHCPASALAHQLLEHVLTVGVLAGGAAAAVAFRRRPISLLP